MILSEDPLIRFVTAYPEGGCMMYRDLDTVVVTKDLPELGLRRGDVGAVVQVYSRDALEVEFVTAIGATLAVVTLGADSVRHVGRKDLLAVRQLDAA
jgi:hypothetical protein